MSILSNIEMNLFSKIDFLKISLEEVTKNFEELNLDNNNDKSANDFRSISLEPSSKDFAKNRYAFLRPAIVQGGYEDVEQYLDIHFRLLREHFMKPLREFIGKYRQSVEKNKDFQDEFLSSKLYRNVQFLKRTEEREKTGILVQIFHDDSYDPVCIKPEGQTLMYGSLVCFSTFRFRKKVFGVVINRDDRYLLRGQFVVQLFDNYNPAFKINYQMIESPEFFEPYYQVMRKLKTLNESNFPMVRYIVSCDMQPSPPKYLNEDAIYELSGHKFKVMEPDSWPDQKQLDLDMSQKDAVQAALTQEFALIQGPPGTGKTYTSLKIVQALLNNAPKKQIMIVCYTNHALDQFLEGLLETLPMNDEDTNSLRVLRVGGRWKSLAIAPYTLRKFRLMLKLYDIFINNQPRSNLFFCLKRDFEVDEKLTESEIKQLRANVLQNPLLSKIYLEGNFSEIKQLRDEVRENRRKAGNIRDLLKVQDFFTYRNDLRLLDKEYLKLTQQIKMLIQEDELSILKLGKVIGMTTTGAAQRQEVLKKLKCPIIIVEEAAQVLESHIIAAMTINCEHLILVGDHKQLQPNTSDSKLSSDYNFDISLFERMVNNGLHCTTLKVQHRMRPEISSLLVPTFYTVLYNHISVSRYSPIKGTNNKNLYFLTHSELEECDGKSKVNQHELRFMSAFANYLVSQGYNAGDITFMSPYKKQVERFSELIKVKVPSLTRMLVKTIDEYQGEENKIILLSLVRSNEENIIGFLKKENRACVALSRAKEGLFIMGNMDSLSQSSSIWSKIKKKFESMNAIGKTLPLQCSRHPNVKTLVSSEEDFSSKILCSELCKNF